MTLHLPGKYLCHCAKFSAPRVCFLISKHCVSGLYFILSSRLSTTQHTEAPRGERPCFFLCSKIAPSSALCIRVLRQPRVTVTWLRYWSQGHHHLCIPPPVRKPSHKQPPLGLCAGSRSEEAVGGQLYHPEQVPDGGQAHQPEAVPRTVPREAVSPPAEVRT